MTYLEILDMVIDSIAIATLLTAFSLCVIAIYKRKVKEPWNLKMSIAFFMYFYMLLYVTVFRGGLFQNTNHSLNLIPFDELLSASYYQSVVNGTHEGILMLVYNVAGNILWFVPYGFLLSFYKKKVDAKQAILYSAAFSLGIEILQYLFYTGVSDIDDVIFNTIGGLIGYGLYVLIQERRRK